MRSTLFLGFLVVLAALLFAGLGSVVWLNRGGDQILGLFLKAVLAPLIVAAFLIASDFAAPLERKQSIVDLTFYQTPDALLANNKLLSDETLLPVPLPYGVFETVGFWWEKSPKKTPKMELSNLHTQMLEAGFCRWLQGRYSTHWQVKALQTKGFEGRVLLSPTIENGAEKDPLLIPLAELAVLSGNEVLDADMQAIKDQGLDHFHKLALPKDATLTIKRLGLGHKQWIIETPRIIHRIDFQWNASGDINAYHNRLTPKIAKCLNSPDAQVTFLQVSFSVETKLLRRWSSRTKAETKWAENMAEAFKEDFQWSAVK